jgi:hypothetical protein
LSPIKYLAKFASKQQRARNLQANNKGQEEEESMSTLEVVVDDEARIRILHPDAHAQSCLVQHSCSTFQSKLHDFHTVKKIKMKNFIH